jgi:hypothetical protein
MMSARVCERERASERERERDVVSWRRWRWRVVDLGMAWCELLVGVAGSGVVGVGVWGVGFKV